MPDPALALGLAQRIDVDDRRPVGLARQIGCQVARPPQAARILRVAPQIGDPAAHHLVGHRNLAFIVQDRARPRPVRLEPRAGAQQLFRLAIPLLDLRDRLCALDILQPEIGIITRGGRGGDQGRSGSDGDRHQGGTERQLMSHGPMR